MTGLCPPSTGPDAPRADVAEIERVISLGMCSRARLAEGPCECCAEKRAVIEAVRHLARTAPDDAARLRHCEATIERVARALGMGDDASAGELVRAIERLRRERDDARSDAASTEYDLARLIVAIHKVDAVPAEVCDLADEIASNGRSGWIARALDPAEVDPCRGVVRELRERAELAEMDRDEAHTEVGQLRAKVAQWQDAHDDALVAIGEAVWGASEALDPVPSAQVIAGAVRVLRAQIETLTRERDEARASVKRAEQERDYWRLSAGNAGRMSPNEARAIGAVLRAAERHERDMRATGRTSGVPLRVAVEAWTAAGRPGVPSEDESA